jgi:hypothetical protein
MLYLVNISLQNQRDAEALFLSLIGLLPCSACRDHYKSEILSRPPDTRSRTTLSTWLVDLHNRVNIRLSKNTVSYSEAEQMYGSLSQCDIECGSPKKEKSISNHSNNTNYIFLALLISFIVILTLSLNY